MTSCFLRRAAIVVIATALCCRAQSPPFGPPDALAHPTTMVPLGLGDFDGDGDPDLLGAGPPYVLLNDGSGRFTPPAAALAPGGATAATSVFARRYALGDFDGDGRVDVARHFGTTGTVWYATGGGFASAALPGVLSTPPTAVSITGFVAGDVDGDGVTDLLCQRYALGGLPAAPTVLFGQTGGGFVVGGALGLTADSSVGDVLILDADGDGDGDVVTGGGGLFRNGGGLFGALGGPDGGATAPTPGVGLLRAADLDGDGTPDVLALEPSRVAVFYGGPTGFATGPALNATVPNAPSFLGVAALDTDSDGADELQVWRADGRFATYAAVGGVLTPIATAVGSGAGGLWVADVDGDGDDDLVHDVAATAAGIVGNLVEYGLAVRFGDGTPSSTCPDAFPPVSVLAGPTPADYDGDGDVDLAGFLSEGVDATLVIGANDGSGRFAWAPAAAPLASTVMPTRSTAGDFDGDGDVDLLLVRVVGTSPPPPGGNGASADVFVNLGGGVFLHGGSTPLAPGTALGAVVADFDGDGRDDVAELSGAGAATPYVRYGSAAGLQPPVAVAPVGYYLELAVGDVAGDGKPDLVLAGQQCAVLRNDGGGVFGVETPFGATAAVRASVADLDADGATDVLLDTRPFLRTASGWIALPSLYNGNPFLPAAGLAAFDFEEDGDVDAVFESGLVSTAVGGGFVSTTIALPTLPRLFVHDFDGDGDRDVLAAARAGGAPNAPGAGVAGVPRLHLNRSRQLGLAAPLRPGRPTRLDVHGAPGGSAWLFVATGAAAVPAPPLGTIYLDPTSAILLWGGTLDAEGRGGFDAVLPPSASAWLGVEFGFQALTDTLAGPRLTNARRATIAAY